MDSSARPWSPAPALHPPSGWDQLRRTLSALSHGPARALEPDTERAVPCLRVMGALDRRLAPELKRQAQAFAALEAAGWSLDLSAVGAWDSDGIASLVYALDVSDLNGKTLTLLNPAPALRHTLERAQLHHLFLIDSQAE